MLASDAVFFFNYFHLLSFAVQLGDNLSSVFPLFSVIRLSNRCLRLKIVHSWLVGSTSFDFLTANLPSGERCANICPPSSTVKKFWLTDDEGLVDRWLLIGSAPKLRFLNLTASSHPTSRVFQLCAKNFVTSSFLWVTQRNVVQNGPKALVNEMNAWSVTWMIIGKTGFLDICSIKKNTSLLGPVTE